MRYYMTQRPPMPGAFPGGADVTEYMEPRMIPEIGREAYAMLEYDHELPAELVGEYELTPETVTVTLTMAQLDLIRDCVFRCANTGMDDDALYGAALALTTARMDALG